MERYKRAPSSRKADIESVRQVNTSGFSGLLSVRRKETAALSRFKERENKKRCAPPQSPVEGPAHGQSKMREGIQAIW